HSRPVIVLVHHIATSIIDSGVAVYACPRPIIITPEHEVTKLGSFHLLVESEELGVTRNIDSITQWTAHKTMYELHILSDVGHTPTSIFTVTLWPVYRASYGVSLLEVVVGYKNHVTSLQLI